MVKISNPNQPMELPLKNSTPLGLKQLPKINVSRNISVCRYTIFGQLF
jgi:hypothetical protein